MNFTTAVKTCFSKYVTFKGRALRSEYWWWTLFTILGSIALSLVEITLLGGSFDDTGILDSLFSLATFLPSIAVAARRLHDVGRSGWWQLIAFTIIGIPVLLYWLIIEGDKGDNPHGPHPLHDDVDNLNEVFR